MMDIAKVSFVDVFSSRQLNIVLIFINCTLLIKGGLIIF